MLTCWYIGMKTNQVNLFAGEWFKGEEEKLDGRETKWRFSSNTPGVVLGVPYIPSAQDAQGGGAQVKFDVKERKMPNYFDLTVGPLCMFDSFPRCLMDPNA